MKTSKAITFFLISSVISIFMLAALNLTTDPLCYYRCSDVSVSRKTLNSYYQNLQRILLYPDTELLVLGSSRGESLPLAWLSSEYDLPALNLSVGGADIHAKSAFLDFALQHLKLRRVIWIADYFELIDSAMSEKVSLTPVIAHLARLEEGGLTARLRKLSTLLDHHTIEASFALLRGKKLAAKLGRGENSDMQLAGCEKKIGEQTLTPERLAKEVNTIYDGYAHSILVPEQNEKSFASFRQIAKQLEQHGIRFDIVLPAYHPAFAERLEHEHREIWQRHHDWLKQVQSLGSKLVRVRNYFASSEFTADPVRSWTDGVHFNCRAAAQMLRRTD